MRQYKIYVNPAGLYETVKQGWSWPAFFFFWIWAFVKKQWGLGAGVLIANIFFILSYLIYPDGQIFLDFLSFIFGLPLAIVFGIYGNGWRELNLLKRGYELQDTVTAANRDGALALYLREQNKQDRQESPP